MNTLKQRNTQEMNNLWKENTILREQYLKLQEEQNENSIVVDATYQTHLDKIDGVEMIWREKNFIRHTTNSESSKH